MYHIFSPGIRLLEVFCITFRAAGPPFRRADSCSFTRFSQKVPGARTGCPGAFHAAPSAIKQQRFLPPGWEPLHYGMPMGTGAGRLCISAKPAFRPCTARAGDVHSRGLCTFPVQGAAPFFLDRKCAAEACITPACTQSPAPAAHRTTGQRVLHLRTSRGGDGWSLMLSFIPEGRNRCCFMSDSAAGRLCRHPGQAPGFYTDIIL